MKREFKASKKRWFTFILIMVIVFVTAYGSESRADSPNGNDEQKNTNAWLTDHPVAEGFKVAGIHQTENYLNVKMKKEVEKDEKRERYKVDLLMTGNDAREEKTVERIVSDMNGTFKGMDVIFTIDVSRSMIDDWENIKKTLILGAKEEKDSLVHMILNGSENQNKEAGNTVSFVLFASTVDEDKDDYVVIDPNGKAELGTTISSFEEAKKIFHYEDSEIGKEPVVGFEDPKTPFEVELLHLRAMITESNANRGQTNCEAGFLGARKQLEAIRKKNTTPGRHAVIVYISDGEITEGYREDGSKVFMPEDNRVFDINSRQLEFSAVKAAKRLEAISDTEIITLRAGMVEWMFREKRSYLLDDRQGSGLRINRNNEFSRVPIEGRLAEGYMFPYYATPENLKEEETNDGKKIFSFILEGVRFKSEPTTELKERAIFMPEDTTLFKKAMFMEHINHRYRPERISSKFFLWQSRAEEHEYEHKNYYLDADISLEPMKLMFDKAVKQDRKATDIVTAYKKVRNFGIKDVLSKYTDLDRTAGISLTLPAIGNSPEMKLELKAAKDQKDKEHLVFEDANKVSTAVYDTIKKELSVSLIDKEVVIGKDQLIKLSYYVMPSAEAKTLQMKSKEKVGEKEIDAFYELNANKPENLTGIVKADDGSGTYSGKYGYPVSLYSVLTYDIYRKDDIKRGKVVSAGDKDTEKGLTEAWISSFKSAVIRPFKDVEIIKDENPKKDRQQGGGGKVPNPNPNPSPNPSPSPNPGPIYIPDNSYIPPVVEKEGKKEEVPEKKDTVPEKKEEEKKEKTPEEKREELEIKEKEVPKGKADPVLKEKKRTGKKSTTHDNTVIAENENKDHEKKELAVTGGREQFFVSMFGILTLLSTLLFFVIMERKKAKNMTDET